MRSGLNPTSEDLKNLLLGGLVVGAGFAGFKQFSSVNTVLLSFLFGIVTVSFREIGQRIVGQWMDAQVELELSENGAATTILIGIFSYFSTIGFVFLTPLYSVFSGESYEHWGKSIDAIWSKRKYWMASSGILTLLIGWFIAYSQNINLLAELVSLFTFFQLLPLDSHKKVCGKLDGAHIILWSGFTWLIFLGLTIIAMIVSIL
jgi:hypothetical protein